MPPVAGSGPGRPGRSARRSAPGPLGDADALVGDGDLDQSVAGRPRPATDDAGARPGSRRSALSTRLPTRGDELAVVAADDGAVVAADADRRSAWRCAASGHPVDGLGDDVVDRDRLRRVQRVVAPAAGRGR